MLLSPFAPPLSPLDGRRDLGGVTDISQDIINEIDALIPSVPQSTRFAILGLSALVVLGAIGYRAHAKICTSSACRRHKSKRSRR